MTDPQPAEGHVAPASEADNAAYHVQSEDSAAQVEATDAVPSETDQPDQDNPLGGMSMDEVVTAVLNGKFTTDAAQQRQRLTAAGYDAEAVKEAVQRRLAQRYE